MGLLDVLQSASNAVAGNVAGPVDLLSFLLRKGGVPVPEDALGGSEWMKRKGLMRDVPKGAEQVVGETLGLLAPTAIAANAPKIARGLLQAQENAAAPRTLSPEAGVFLMHTPKKPNPAVGTRYETEYIGGLADKAPVKIEDLKGSSLLSMPWDLTSRNYKVKAVSDELLPQPVLTTGGQDFARDLAHIAMNVGGASNLGIAKRIQNRAKAAETENVAAGGSGAVYHVPTTMAPTSMNFSTMPTDVLLQLVDKAGMSKKAAKEFDNSLRTLLGPGNKPIFGGFRGLLTDEGRNQLRVTGIEGGATAGELRKAFVDRMNLKENQARIGFNAEDVVAALTDPSLRGVRDGMAGNTIIRAFPDERLMRSTHPSYDTDIPGRYFGSMANVPLDVLMPKAWEKTYAEMATRGGDVRKNTIGALQRRGAGVSEVVDDRVIESVNRYLEGLLGRAALR